MSVLPSASTGLPLISFNRTSPKIIAPNPKNRAPLKGVHYSTKHALIPYTPMARNPLAHDSDIYVDPSNLMQSMLSIGLTKRFVNDHIQKIQQNESLDLQLNRAMFNDSEHLFSRFTHPDYYAAYQN